MPDVPSERTATSVAPDVSGVRSTTRSRRPRSIPWGRRLPRYWRYRLAPDPLKRHPKGMLRFWTRARRLLWSWRPWSLAFLYAMVHDKWGWAIGMGAMALVSYLIAPSETAPRYGLDHEFAVGDEEFLPTMAGATGVPLSEGNRLDILNNGDAFYPAMLDAIRSARFSITVEAYIYWAGDIGKEFAEALAAQSKQGIK